MSALVFGSLFFLLVCCCIAQEGSSPAILSPVTVDGETGSCPSAQVLEQARNSTRETIHEILQNRGVKTACPCGGPGEWHRITHLNMSDPNQQCPTNLTLITTPIRACGRTSTGLVSCDSTFLPTNNQPYSRVCGRVRGYQYGSPDAFLNYNSQNQRTLDSVYLDGISLTHGAAGSRQHIWSFVAALYEDSPQTNHICPCTNANANWPHEVPPFIGNDYFCDSGNPGITWSPTVYLDNPLWDGEGCGSTSTCCQFNTPPWFCTTLPQSTTDDIELRTCYLEERINENVLIDLIDIYVM